MKKTTCKICSNKDTDFITVNDSFDYSGIEMCINNQGMFRIRVYPGEINNGYNQMFIYQDILNVKYCPFCGRKF